MDNDFCVRLKRQRKRLGMTQRALSQLIEVESNTIYKWESGAMLPSMETVKKLATTLRTSISYLLGETDNPEPPGSSYPSAMNTMIGGDNSVVANVAGTVNVPTLESSIIVEHGEGASKTRIVLPAGTPGDVVAHIAKELRGS
jgi:transcriptional regulator with XRE-family HTH domain